MADSMPNEQKQHLPSCLTKEKVYRMYEEDMKTLHKESKRIGYTQFRNMWREHFQHVLIPKVCFNSYYSTKPRLSKMRSDPILLSSPLHTLNQYFPEMNEWNLWMSLLFCTFQVNRFTKCGICTIIKEHIHKLKGKTRRVTWLERKNIHLQQQA